MQKLIILDSETGVATIMIPDIDIDFDDSESVEYYMEELGYNVNSCSYMVALEINDTTK